MDLHLHDTVALVTGGASGIGRACVDALVTENAHVLILDRSGEGQSVADAHRSRGARVDFVQTDITDEAQVRRAVDHALDTFGGLDTVLGCAGISGPVGARATQVSVDEWDRVMAVNVRGNFLLAKHTVNYLQNSDVGTLVFLASDAALVAFEGMAPYSTSKGAVLMLTRSLSVDHPQVRVNALCPGIVDTPMSRADLGRADGFAGTNLPVMSAHQLAGHALFLASPISAPINGTALVSDFGYLARSAVGALDFTSNSEPASNYPGPAPLLPE
ncbi:3-oxoacyl-[acyl-carrier protein] reductase [Rhodococcus wratislaviensis]|uniref:3-oxoacyl-[acyl-carrier protein] reductase n=1 Tax=Rhodococcus wratislaviensis TaxID=44752 RepID=A0A402BZH4_RHOWR|nr:SDR family oxidoreductase [Rhodococcus wratislaviensis]GCE36746.1 3-oxoacyl-[acyl-carrier protein] reductase [Rhodococcus wratislaviensis]